MKRNRSSKSKSSKPALGQGEASSSPAKTSAVGARPRKGHLRQTPDKASENATDDSVTNPPTKDATSGPQDEDRAASPDPNCSICLCRMEDKSFTHSCFHMFCFTCLLEWSKIKAECPLCKQSFTSIIHNIRSESDYDVHQLQDSASAVIAASPQTVSTDDDVQLYPFLFGRSPLRSWTPLLSPIDLQLLAEFRTTATHSIPQGFYSDDAFHLFQHVDGRSQIYRDERWAREVNLPPGLTYRNVSPEYFSASVGGEYWQQVATWLDRELAALSRHTVSMRRHVRDYVMHLLQRYDIRSMSFHAEVEPFFGSQTRLFVNQLHSFVRSPLSIRETDRQTIYSDQPPPPPESEVITLDRDDSDIEIVSPAGTDAARSQRRHVVWDPGFMLPLLPLQIVGAPRDDSPIAGPSGLLGRQQTAELDRDFLRTPDCDVTDLHEVSDSESESPTSGCDNEIVVVGFDKPWRARSPISLSSDGSDVEVDESCTDTNPSSSNKSPESSVVRSQTGQGVETTKAPGDEEGDARSFRPWSDFSSDGLSEISSAGSVDRSLERFLRANSPLIGFEHRYAPEKGLEVFEEGSNICERCPEDVGVNVNKNEGQALTGDSFVPKRQSRKRNRDDCGDSGVVVDLGQSGDSEEPPPKKSAYKKHNRGHKKSAPYKSDGSLGSDGNHTTARPEEPPVGDPHQVRGDAEEPGIPSPTGDIRAVSEGLTASVLEQEPSEKSPRCGCSHDGTGEPTDVSSVATCDNSTDSNTKSAGAPSSGSSVGSSTSEKNRSSDANDGSESTTGYTSHSGVSETSRVCDDVSLHSIESIDSDDSVQWLDFERPVSSNVEQRQRHISIGSNESFPYSPSVNSVVLQLSDDDEEEEDCDSIDWTSSEASAILSANGIDDSRHSPQRGSNLPNFEDVDDKPSVNGVKYLSEFLEDIYDDLDSTFSDNGTIVSLLQLTGSESGARDEQTNRVECLPVSSESVLEHETGDNNISKSDDTSDNVRYNEKPVNGVNCDSESTEDELECQLDNACSAEKLVNGVNRDSESTEDEQGCELDSARYIEKPVKGIKCHSESIEEVPEYNLCDNGIVNTENVLDVVPCNGAMTDSIVDDVHLPAIPLCPLSLCANDRTSEPQMRTSNSCPVRQACDVEVPAAAELNNDCEKSQSGDLLPVDESC